MTDYPPIGAEVKANVIGYGWKDMILMRKRNIEYGESQSFYSHKLYWQEIHGEFKCALNIVTDWYFNKNEKLITRRMA